MLYGMKIIPTDKAKNKPFITIFCLLRTHRNLPLQLCVQVQLPKECSCAVWANGDVRVRGVEMAVSLEDAWLLEKAWQGYRICIKHQKPVAYFLFGG